jgi:hypothetical protein
MRAFVTRNFQLYQTKKERTSFGECFVVIKVLLGAIRELRCAPQDRELSLAPGDQ